jgi:hypothetical protein
VNAFFAIGFKKVYINGYKFSLKMTVTTHVELYLHGY